MEEWIFVHFFSSLFAFIFSLRILLPILFETWINIASRAFSRETSVASRVFWKEKCDDCFLWRPKGEKETLEEKEHREDHELWPECVDEFGCHFTSGNWSKGSWCPWPLALCDKWIRYTSGSCYGVKPQIMLDAEGLQGQLLWDVGCTWLWSLSP